MWEGESIYSVMHKKTDKSMFNNVISEKFRKLLYFFTCIMYLMKAHKNFGKLTILKIWKLISLGGLKTHFGKLALEWCMKKNVFD